MIATGVQVTDANATNADKATDAGVTNADEATYAKATDAKYFLSNPLALLRKVLDKSLYLLSSGLCPLLLTWVL